MLNWLHLTWLLLPFMFMAEAADGGGGGGGDGGAFQATLGEFKGHTALSSFKDAPSLAKGYVELSGKLGQPVVDRLDVKDAGTLQKLYSKLGRPEKPDGYGLKNVNFAAKAHALGLGVDQAKGMAELVDAENASAAATRAEQRKAALADAAAKKETTLKAEWGAKYADELALADKALNRDDFIPKDLRDALNDTGLIHHPAMVKALNKFGHAMQEGSLSFGSAGSGGNQAGDRGAALEALRKYEKDNSKLLLSQRDGDPAVAAAKAKRTSLMDDLRRFDLPERAKAITG